jgi:hypothetical protein
MRFPIMLRLTHVPVSDSFARSRLPQFFVGHHLFRIKDLLTLDSPANLDSNRRDSE